MVSSRKYPHRPLDSFLSCGTITAFFLLGLEKSKEPGWGRWIRTIGMQESKSCALPLGDTPISKQVLTVAQRVELLAARVELDLPAG